MKLPGVTSKALGARKTRYVRTIRPGSPNQIPPVPTGGDLAMQDFKKKPWPQNHPASRASVFPHPSPAEWRGWLHLGSNKANQAPLPPTHSPLSSTTIHSFIHPFIHSTPNRAAGSARLTYPSHHHSTPPPGITAAQKPQEAKPWAIPGKLSPPSSIIHPSPSPRA